MIETETIPTPSQAFNIISLGGIRFSTLTELWGANKSGKTTFCYETGGLFHKKFKDGLIVLIDPELAHDKMRLKLVYEWDMERIILPNIKNENEITINGKKRKLNPAPMEINTVEDVFTAITRYIDEFPELPILIIVDTISVVPTKNEFNNMQEYLEDDTGKKELKMWSGGQNELQRITKYLLKQVMTRLAKTNNVAIMMPNQIYQDTSPGYVQKGEVSGGGSGFKHDLHYSLHFKTVKNFFDETEKDITYSYKELSITKSRFCPEVSKIPFYISVADGGKVDDRKSTLLLCQDYDIIKDKGMGWYYMEDYPEKGNLANIRDKDIEALNEEEKKEQKAKHLKVKVKDSATGEELYIDTKNLKGVRWDVIESDDAVYEQCKVLLQKHYESKYYMVRMMREHMEMEKEAKSSKLKKEKETVK